MMTQSTVPTVSQRSVGAAAHQRCPNVSPDGAGSDDRKVHGQTPPNVDRLLHHSGQYAAVKAANGAEADSQLHPLNEARTR
jgi:hypothetical protein